MLEFFAVQLSWVSLLGKPIRAEWRSAKTLAPPILMGNLEKYNAQCCKLIVVLLDVLVRWVIKV